MLAFLLSMGSQHEAERFLDKKFGNVDLSTSPYQPPSQEVLDERIVAAAAKRARKAARRRP